MKKNRVTYRNVLEFDDKEGLILDSSKEEHLDIIHYFEGKCIDNVEIKDGYIHEDGPMKGILTGRYLLFYVYVQRHIDAKKYPITEGKFYEEDEITVDTDFRFYFSDDWKLYDKDVLVYDNEDLSKYPTPKQYQKLLNGTQLEKIDIDSAWQKATFSFTSGVRLVVTNTQIGRKVRKFFSINKQTDPFTMCLDFAKPDIITYRNDARWSKVVLKKTK